MEVVLLSLLLCLQWCYSMPPHLYGEIQPESELFSEDGHKLGQLYEDIDDIKDIQQAQDHQIEILQNDVHGLSYVMEEQSILLDKLMEREGLVLENNHDDREFFHNKNQLESAEQLRRREHWEDEKGDSMSEESEESEEMEKEHIPFNNEELHTRKHDEEEYIPFHDREKHTPVEDEGEYIESDYSEEHTPIEDEEAYLSFEDEEEHSVEEEE